MSQILVYIQIVDGGASDVSLQSLACARSLADATGGAVTALALGYDIGMNVADLVERGADRVLVAEDDRLSHYLTGPYKRVVRSVLDANRFDVVLFPATTEGNDLAPILAAELGCGCVVGCDAIHVKDGKTLFRRTEFDRKVHTDYEVTVGPAIATLRDGIAEIPALGEHRGEAQTIAVDLGPAEARAQVVKRNVVPKTVNLKASRVIVAAGAGVGGPDGFGLVKDLAKALDAQMGATRAVVDAGWLPADHQIGQTGVTVRPDLYIACGISGAVQHWVGMSDAKTIVAINTDKNAPMMKRAHYRIEADLKTVIPKMLKVLSA